MTFEPLDVVVVPFPFTDRATTKRRPALVVSSDGFNSAHRQTILAMITSVADNWPSDVPLRHWREAGLKVPCKLRLKLFTLDNAVVAGKVGALSPNDGAAARNALAEALAISQSAVH